MSMLCTLTTTSDVAGHISVTAEDLSSPSSVYSLNSAEYPRQQFEGLTGEVLSTSLSTSDEDTPRSVSPSLRSRSRSRSRSRTPSPGYTLSNEKARSSGLASMFGRHNSVKLVSIADVIPRDYSAYYCAEVLSNRSQLLPSGRPVFTDRSLVDWKINDLRSLLIVDQLKPQWGKCVPRLKEKGFRLMHLPLTASDDEIVETLATSDLYREHNFDHDFLVQTAKYTVHAARERAYYRYCKEVKSRTVVPRMSRSMSDVPLTRPEWRNVIENYLLNLGCEAQCRRDYKDACVELKKHKAMLEQQQQQASMACGSECNNGDERHTNMTCQSRIKTIPSLKKNQSTSLLKRAILTAVSTSPETIICQCCSAAGVAAVERQREQQQQLTKKVSLSRQEKQTVWVTVQTQLYKRLGLDWEADKLV